MKTAKPSICLLLLITFFCGCTNYKVSRQIVKAERYASADINVQKEFEKELLSQNQSNVNESSPPKAPLPADTPANDPARLERLVIYNAVMNVVVDNISESINQIKAVAVNMGGYMQKMDSQSITLRIPSQRFNDVITEVEKLGLVTRKDIKGSDVTDEMRDLNIRLQNAEQIRERLIKLLDKAEKVEDTLKIEKELGRVTEEIELLKGKIAHLKDDIAYSTFTIYFNSPVPQQDISTKTPFSWIHSLGSMMMNPEIDNAYVTKSFWHQPLFLLPRDYIIYFDDEQTTRAMSAESSIISAQKYENYKGGTAEFWADLINRFLTEQKTISIKEKSEIKLKTGITAKVLIGNKQIGTKQYGYMVAIAVNNDYVCVLEAWGQSSQFQKDRIKLEKAVESLRIK